MCAFGRWVSFAPASSLCIAHLPSFPSLPLPGEAYDKVARLLGLELKPSGGAALEAFAREGDPRALPFSVPMQVGAGLGALLQGCFLVASGAPVVTQDIKHCCWVVLQWHEGHLWQLQGTLLCEPSKQGWRVLLTRLSCVHGRTAFAHLGIACLPPAPQRRPTCDFSYAGLKTAVRLAIEEQAPEATGALAWALPVMEGGSCCREALPCLERGLLR